MGCAPEEIYLFYDSLNEENQRRLLHDLVDILQVTHRLTTQPIHAFLQLLANHEPRKLIHRALFEYQNQKNQELIIQIIEATILFKPYYDIKIFYNFHEIPYDFLTRLFTYAHSQLHQKSKQIESTI